MVLAEPEDAPDLVISGKSSAAPSRPLSALELTSPLFLALVTMSSL